MNEREKPWVWKAVLASLIVAGLGIGLMVTFGCQSTKNVTHIYVYDNSSATITADGGSNEKPVDVARGLRATVPLTGM